MVNNHYVPQLILRHFCEDDKIQYYNLENHTVESRNTKSVFSEKGYYPDELEQDLCHKVEVQFANVLNKKILSGSYKVSLTVEDMLTVKKFLIITTLRVRDDDLEHNAWYQVLKRDGFISEEDPYKEFFKGDFFDNLNRVLACKTQEELMQIIDTGENMNLFTFVKDVVYSYNVFVKSNNCKEDFIIPDRGWAGYRGPMSVKKLNAMLNMLEIRYDPYIDMLVQMSSPQDYMVFPLTRNLALIAMSPAFKICVKGAPYNIIYPDNAPSLSECLGFGYSDIINPPDNKFLRNGGKEYKYEVKQLSKQDVKFLNSLLLKNTEQFFGFASSERVKASLSDCSIEI